MIERLVAFDTTSALSNLALIDFAVSVLEPLGARIRLTGGAGKANMFASIGPEDRPGIVLSGHTDTVPAEPSEWRSNPFILDERDGRLHGRGTADMKSFLAVCLALAPEFASHPLAGPIHFAFSHDEEVGCMGVRSLIEDLGALSVQPRLCIVGEPTEMRVIIGHKGKKNVRCHVHGSECHSAYNHRGVNAVEVAAEIVTHLARMQKRIRTNGPFEDGYDPPYTTIHTGLIRGGTALNIVPRECWFEFEFRNLPGHDPESLMAELRAFAQTLVPEMLAVAPEAGFTFNDLNTTAGLVADSESVAARLACRLSGANDTGKVSFTTEAGLFQEAGIPAVICGPGSIMQAHKPDEFITLEQVAACEDFLRRLLKSMQA